MKQILNFLLALLSLVFIFLMGLIPFAILYVISDMLRILLFHVFRYRRKVVTSNLKKAFPDLDRRELEKLVMQSYKNLMDIIVESFKAFTMTRRQIMNRHKILNPELVNPYFESGRSVISLPCHYGNWEWGSLSPAIQLNYPIVAFYKPLSNPWADRFIKWSRSRYGTILSSIYRTTETFSERKDAVTAYVMAADQSPSNADKAYWVDFLGLETAFLHGPEKHARNNDIPVIFVDIQRVKRGHYTLLFSLITDNPGQMEEGEITQAYARKLESAIRKQPQNWLWSHRRWKLKH